MTPPTTDQVAALLPDYDASISMAPFIDAAVVLVEEKLTVPDIEPAYSESRLTMIATWLAAHFYSIRETQVLTEKAGSVSQTFSTKVGLMLKVTTYGQQAMLLDTSLTLARLSNNAEKGVSGKAKATWLGTSRC